MRAVLVLMAAALALGGCGDDIRGSVTIVAAEPFAAVLTELAAQMPARGVRVGDEDAVGNGFRVDVREDSALPAEGYRLEASRDGLIVHARDILGAQYGTAAALEAMGYRFRHPHEIYTPEAITSPVEIDGRVHQPDIRVRGFQYHTLHPIETYYAFWEPSAQSLFEAKRMIDWTVKNRGNYIQWVALDNIILSADAHAAWKPFTQEILAYAHARGIRVGLNIQLFGQSNLQQAFDLVDDNTGTVPIADQMAARLPLITQDLPFDVYDVSFGEFFNADSQTFIDSVNELHDQLKVLAPQAEMHAFIHVGGAQEVTYMGETLFYYFLVKFANPEIIHDVHSVMFYNLFETASGAYHSDDFFVHRDYLIDQICADRRPAYVPETAYWVAFDNSVPMYMPIYIYNRWLDLERIKATAGAQCGKNLDAHVLFTTGWEWGYWMHDTASLRASYELPPDVGTLIAEEAGEDLAPAAPFILELAELQRQYLHLGGLQAYMQGRDQAIDAGDMADIVSQPDRTTFADLEAGADPVVFQTTVLAPVAEYVGKLEGLSARLQAVDLPDSRWTREILDGVAVDIERARFVRGAYTAALAHLAGDASAADAGHIEAVNALAAGRTVVARRHGDLHDPYGRRLLDVEDIEGNATFYQYGYLRMSDTLCFWRRELIQVEQLMGLATDPVPDCLLE